MRAFLGYRRPDGRVGVRNHVLVLPTVMCANAVVEGIARHVPEVVAVTHPYGCTLDPVSNAEMTHILAGTASNPNVYGTILVALGCETVSAHEVAARVAETGKPVEVVAIQGEGDTVVAMERGISIAECLVRESRSALRVEVPLSELTVALECGASDAFSGLTANPAVGRACDILVGLGATVILSEVTEFLGAEHILADQAADEEVRRQILALVAKTEEELARIGPHGEFSDITPGNIAGGLTTIEEKSLGCIRKGGTTPICEVVEYGQRPSKPGLVIMDTPGHDIESLTAMMAGGAQVGIFTTGRGTPTGSAIAPVVKVVSNTPTYFRMRRNIDINAGSIADGTESLDAVAERIVDFIVDVASGALTASERYGHREFAMRRRGTYCTVY